MYVSITIQAPLPIADLPVAQVGGSLTGLLCGVALKHAGHTVQILEQHGNDRKGHGIGIGLGPSAQELLLRHDRIHSPFSNSVSSIRLLAADGSVRQLAAGRRDITSWDALFHRLRALFDGQESAFYPCPPRTLASDGLATYKVNQKVVGIRHADTGSHQIEITVEDRVSKRLHQIEADFLVGADGPSSVLRSMYMPEVERQYVGYIIWRGLIPETAVSPKTRALFHDSIISHMLGQQHCVSYMVPSASGSLEPGERLINFIWYINEAREDLEAILTDRIDGHIHHNFVPEGHVRRDIWEARRQQAKELPLPAPFLELVERIHEPYVQVVTEYCSPRAAFENGRVLLIGDALSQFRPHAALSVAQAAFHVSALEEYMSGTLSLRRWENRVVRRSYLHFLLNKWWGSFYQMTMPRALPAAIHYWSYWAIYMLLAWWNGEVGIFSLKFLTEDVWPVFHAYTCHHLLHN